MADLLVVARGEASACREEDLGLIPELGRSPGKGNGNPLQYSCLENPMDRGVHGVAKGWTSIYACGVVRSLSVYLFWLLTRNAYRIK